MTKNLRQLFRPVDPMTMQQEVEEELRFHIEMQALDFESDGLPPDAAYARATQRFGNSTKIKRECIGILVEDTRTVRVVKLLFKMSLVAGVLIKFLTSEFRQQQIGNMLIMIGVLGVLLLWAKRFTMSQGLTDKGTHVE